jgi:hypothetical protein
MVSIPLVYSQSRDVDQRLADLGLEAVVLNTAALQGLAGWASCTLNHPPTYPGTVAWAETTRALREGLFARGWMRKNEANLPLVVNAAGTMAIAIASGDSETGNEDGFPCTRSTRGPKTAEAVRINRQQQSFDFMDPIPVIESINTPGRSTWLFLMYRDLATRMLRAELSRPISMTDEGRVDEWAERIILTAVPFGDDPQTLNNNNVNQSPEITVEIQRLGS